jgi:hypothetical protein
MGSGGSAAGIEGQGSKEQDDQKTSNKSWSFGLSCTLDLLFHLIYKNTKELRLTIT